MSIRVTASDRLNSTVSDTFVITISNLVTEKGGIIVGTPQDDLLIAAIGTPFNGESNIVFAAAGNDTVDLTPISAFISSGGNRISLGSDRDIIFVNGGDRIFGGFGDDIFEATEGQGANRISGGAGNDIFFLGSSDRTLGDAGNDEFYVGVGGGNTIAGGSGNDQFWIVNAELPEAANTILDFQIGTDVIGLSGSASLGITISTLTLNQVGKNTAIAFNGQTLAILNGIQANSLSVNNPNQFIFA